MTAPEDGFVLVACCFAAFAAGCVTTLLLLGVRRLLWPGADDEACQHCGRKR